MTGGYGGLMEAAASGAASRGGHVLGLPMRSWSGLSPNRHASELLWCDSYPERLDHLLGCDAVVALDGGIGTIAELTVVWSVRQTEPRAPAVVVAGRGWPALLATIAGQMVVDAGDLALVSIAETPEDVIGAIDRQLRLGRAPLPRG
jgi:predicted Rossmann-fold nucleotide-binding protein